mmetsp:Transcript_38749/g.86181  ORF Transcript_38749/g.86181 Transcript_38749/m.86181 type:complete len:244 (-) Transcript_38749:590-1321(-)
MEALVPLDVVHEGPEVDAAHVITVLDALENHGQVAVDEVVAVAAVLVSQAGLGDVDGAAQDAGISHRVVQPLGVQPELDVRHRLVVVTGPHVEPPVDAGAGVIVDPPPVNGVRCPGLCKAQHHPLPRRLPFEDAGAEELEDGLGGKPVRHPLAQQPDVRCVAGLWHELDVLVHQANARLLAPRHGLEGLVHHHMRLEQHTQHLTSLLELHDLTRAPQPSNVANKRKASGFVECGPELDARAKP